MESACTAGDSNTAPTEPMHKLSANIQQQLASMRSVQLPRLLQLRARLQSQVFDWDDALLAQSLGALHSAARGMFLPSLCQGWLARLAGRQQAARKQFIASCERAVACASQVKDQLVELAASHGDHVGETRSVLAGLEAELGALNSGIDQGVTRLQEMCTQLTAARVQGDDDERLATLAEMAQFHTLEFKHLQSVGSQVEEIILRSNSVLARRAALLEQARGQMEAFDQAWMPGTGAIVADLEAGRRTPAGLPRAIEVHEELLRRLSITTDACTALQHEEHLLAHQLGMLEREIDRGGAR